MDIRLLGPVELAVEERVLDVGTPQQRLLLGVLAAEAGRSVGAESLIDRVWDEPPAGARRTLQVHVSRLRRLLDSAAAPSGRPSIQVVRRSGGYLLDIDPDWVDVHRFRRLVDRARDRQRPDRERLALLGRAVDLWRGRPLSDLSGDWVARVRAAWEQQYLDTVVVWAYGCLRAGDLSAVLPRLTELVGEHPLVESLAAVFMRALYAAGRTSEALDHYASVRRRLAEDLGADPGPELQRLHLQILSADPALASPAVTVEYREVPRQLPTLPQAFTGRAAELAALERAPDPSVVVVVAIVGMAGVGKTALAVHAAHRIALRYPGGQLFVDLRGYTQDAAPVEPGDALDRMLRALGVPGEQIPADLDERAGLYRSRLAHRQVLIVLDNAASEDQILPLLPGTPGCLVLVTSRRRLAGIDHTHTVSLDVLPQPDAVALFVGTAGEDRVATAPPELLAETVELCGRLPLAIRLAAARFTIHRMWTLAHLVERLREQQHRLSELEAGRRSVTGALDLSYQQLPPSQQRAYRLLGLHPGRDLTSHATAALIGTAVATARQLLDQLLDAHLLQEAAPGRYRFHELTRAHANLTAQTADAEPDRRAALTKLLDHYRHTATVAIDTAYPYQPGRRFHSLPADPLTPTLPDAAQATTWLDAELPNILAAARHAATHGWPEHTLHISGILHQHLRTRGRYTDAEALHSQALTTARATGERADELNAHLCLGQVHGLQRRYERAADHYRRALQLAVALLEPAAEVCAHDGLAHAYRGLHQPEPARRHWGQALDILADLGTDHLDETGVSVAAISGHLAALDHR